MHCRVEPDKSFSAMLNTANAIPNDHSAEVGSTFSVCMWNQTLLQSYFLVCGSRFGSCSFAPVRDSYTLFAQIRVHNTYQPDTKSNPNSNPTTKQHAIVNIQQNIVAFPTYPDKFTRDMLSHHVCDLRL